MHIKKMNLGQIIKNRDFINLSILLAISLGIGVYLIAQIPVISKDGITFIGYAKQLKLDPVKTMLNESQHPGYPLLILIAHNTVNFLHKSSSIFSWIYCGQGTTLIFRLLTMAVLYFIGKKLFGAKMSFWAVLILIILPKPAEYGSDVLSDWPNLFFLTAGLLLFVAAANRKWQIFGLVGLISGMGYLIRPECAQLILICCLWLGFQFFRPDRVISRYKISAALLLLFAGFFVAAGPYMKLKGSLFPKKDFDVVTQDIQKTLPYPRYSQIILATVNPSRSPVINIAKAFHKFFQNVGETLMWFFVPMMLIGMYKWFKMRKWHQPEAFFVIAMIAMNLPLMILLHCKYGYMSYRHTLGLLIIPILYVPLGLHWLVVDIQHRYPAGAESAFVESHNENFWFIALFLTGFLICTPKLFRFKHQDKIIYRTAASWLADNTAAADIIAVPDPRISFYAQRTGVEYDDEKNIPKEAAYIVKILKNSRNKTTSLSQTAGIEFEYFDTAKRGLGVIIYRNR